MLGPKTSSTHIVAPFLSGGAVGCTSCTILYPLHFCNTRITVDVGDNKIIKREFHGLNDCISKIYKSDGYRGFYQGMTLSMCGLSLYRFFQVKFIISSVKISCEIKIFFIFTRRAMQSSTDTQLRLNLYFEIIVSRRIISTMELFFRVAWMKNFEWTLQVHLLRCIYSW